MESQIQFIKLTKCGLNFKIFAKLNYGYTFLNAEIYPDFYPFIFHNTPGSRLTHNF